jgi:hypothetical protein
MNGVTFFFWKQAQDISKLKQLEFLWYQDENLTNKQYIMTNQNLEMISMCYNDYRVRAESI